MKIHVCNGAVRFRFSVPRGVKVQAYSSGLFVSGPDYEKRFDFEWLRARGFSVELVQSCAGWGSLVSWVGGQAGDINANRWWIACE